MYRKKTHIHFVGIGGIGMSGIAKILVQQNYYVSGCDNDLTQKSVLDLKQLGCPIYEGNDHPQCNDDTIDTLVHSSAVKSSHPEIARAKRRGIPTIPRGIMLAELTRTKYTIAVAGSHGKTTTTSIITHIFMETNMDPTAIIGGHLHSISSNAHSGSGDFLITETDESDRSLLHLYPTLAVVTTIDLEHLETYKNLHDIIETFRQFLMKVPFYGKAFVCLDDQNIRSLLPLDSIPTATYGSTDDAEWYYQDAHLEPTNSSYTLYHKGTALGQVTMPMPGIHNLLNSVAAVAVSLTAGISFEDVTKALASFSGVDRRFTFKGTFQGAEIFDDYGHHPTEIACTLKVARNRAKKKLTVIFQPHRYIRTEKLWKDFVHLFASSTLIDNLIVTDLYSAGESPIEGITSQRLVEEIKKHHPQCSVSYLPLEPNFCSLHSYLSSQTAEDDLILLQGAGNLNKIVPFIAKN